MASPAPRRRHSAAVYRRRRLVLLLLVLLVVAAVVWLLVARPWSTAAAEQDAAPRPSASVTAASPSPAPAATSTPEPEATTPPASASQPTPTAAPSPSLTPAAQPCRASDLAVQAVTDHDTYDSGQNPQLSITLTNNGKTDCTLNVGTSTQKFTIKSGNDVWWRSTDCQTEPSDMIVLLAAGQSVTSATPVAWDRTRSSVDSCTATDRQRAPGGGASYHLSVEIGGIVAPQSTQMLLY